MHLLIDFGAMWPLLTSSCVPLSNTLVLAIEFIVLLIEHLCEKVSKDVMQIFLPQDQCEGVEIAATDKRVR